MVDILIISAIVGYGSFMLFRHFKRSSKGKCGSCEIESSCSGSTCDVDWNKVIDEARNSEKNK